MLYLTKKETNIMKSIAIIFVLLCHYQWWINDSLSILKNAGTWGVTIFLFLSGYGLDKSYKKNGLNNFLQKRLLRVILPYSLVTICLIFANIFLLNNNYNPIVMVFTVLGLNPQSPLDSTMWYITYIIIWYIAFYVVFKLIKNDFGQILGLFIFSIVSFYLVRRIFTNDAGVIYYPIQFTLGVMISKIDYKYKFSNKADCIIGIISLLMFIITLGDSAYIPKMINILSVLPIIILSVKMISKFNLNILIFIGSISYELYLLEAIFMKQHKFIFNTINNNIVAFSVYFIFITLLSLVIQKVVNAIMKFIYEKEYEVIN